MKATIDPLTGLPTFSSDEPVNISYAQGNAGGVRSVVAGTNITVNNTDPLNPIVSATGGGGGSGDVVGPASATDNAIARFDTTTGKLIQNSGASIDDQGGLSLTGQASPTYSAGKIVYDTGNDSFTAYNSDANVALQIGQEAWIRVVNNTGSTIANGSAVYINGASGGWPTVALAQANSATTTIGAGLATESIANGATGFVTSLGAVRNFDTSAFAAGATVFISATVAGGLTATAPTAPNYRYRVGIVGVSSATVGTIHVTPSTAALGNGTANQVFGINAAGTAQEVKSIVGTASQVTITNTANTITASLPATINVTAANVTTNANLTGDVTSSGNATTYANPVPVTLGGTTLTGFTTGTFLTASSTTALASVKTAPTGVVVGTTDTQTLSAKTLSGVTIADATNIVLNTTTGTKIGTATGQKLGFYNATPVIQPLATTDLGTVLSDTGLRAAGTAYPITTSGLVTMTGTTTSISNASLISVRSQAMTRTGTSFTPATGVASINYIDATAGAYLVTLPATTTTGYLFTFKKIDATANVVTIKAGAAGTIDAANTYLLSTQYKYVTVSSTSVSDVWYVIGNN